MKNGPPKLTDLEKRHQSAISAFRIKLGISSSRDIMTLLWNLYQRPKLRYKDWTASTPSSGYFFYFSSIILTYTSDILKHCRHTKCASTYEHLQTNVTIHCSEFPVIFDSCQSRGPKILGFPLLFDNCPPNLKDQIKKRAKSRLSSTLKKWRQKSWKNSINFSFQLFYDWWDINITQGSWFTLYRRKILEMSGFLWEKGALFSGFHNGEWKLKKRYPFFQFWV